MSHFNEAANQWDNPEKIARARECAAAIRRRVSRAGRVMDIGCGTGLLSYEFAASATSILGVDTSEGMLRVFDEKAKGFPQARSLRIDLELHDLPAQEQFDLIISSMAFHHLARPANLLRKLRPALASGGKFAIVDLDQEDGTFHPDPVKMGVKHFGFSEVELHSWAEEAGLKLESREIIQEIEKNGKPFPVFLAVFGL